MLGNSEREDRLISAMLLTATIGNSVSVDTVFHETYDVYWIKKYEAKS